MFRSGASASGGAVRLSPHVVADPGHDAAERVDVVGGERGEEQAPGDLDVAGQDAADPGEALLGEGDHRGALVLRGGAAGDQAGLLQESRLVGEPGAEVDPREWTPGFMRRVTA
ncbi:hypothetical protein GCM10022384_47390 [Streptomyces marokkonensis]|uniref:Uncharacterized protein n=1 Tax=Streptomyces marokkonensis TaxID=324855 RepID=A0ABP7R968_9ACTN